MRVIESERLWVFPISNYHTDCYVKQAASIETHRPASLVSIQGASIEHSKPDEQPKDNGHYRSWTRRDGSLANTEGPSRLNIRELDRTGVAIEVLPICITN